jgi:hypothetical protein
MAVFMAELADAIGHVLLRPTPPFTLALQLAHRPSPPPWRWW